MEAIRNKTIKLYVDLIAGIASTPCHGKTLRQALCVYGSYTLWWYHRLSAKDITTMPSFDRMLHILTISHVATQQKIYKNRCEHLSKIRTHSNQVKSFKNGYCINVFIVQMV